MSRFFCDKNFAKITLGIKIVSEGVNEWNINITFFPFYPYLIIEAIFNRQNLQLSQKAGQWDTFLN